MKLTVKTFVFESQYANELRGDIVELARKGFQSYSNQENGPLESRHHDAGSNAMR